MFNLLVSFAIVLTIIIGGLTVQKFILDRGRMYDRFTENISWGAYLVEVTGKKIFDECENFIDEVSNYIPINTLERKCSLWYRVCTVELKEAPPSPWSRLMVSEEDLNAITYLKFDCVPSEIEELRKEWARKNFYFNEKNQYEQYNLIKNACGATIVKKINR